MLNEVDNSLWSHRVTLATATSIQLYGSPHRADQSVMTEVIASTTIPNFQATSHLAIAAYCYTQRSVVGRSVRSLSRSWALQNGWTDRDALWDGDSGGPKEPRIRSDADPQEKEQFWGKVATHCKLRSSSQRIIQWQARSTCLQITRAHNSSAMYRHCADTFPQGANCKTLMLKPFLKRLPVANEWRFVRATRYGLSSNYIDHLLPRCYNLNFLSILTIRNNM